MGSSSADADYHCKDVLEAVEQQPVELLFSVVQVQGDSWNKQSENCFQESRFVFI